MSTNLDASADATTTTSAEATTTTSVDASTTTSANARTDHRVVKALHFLENHRNVMTAAEAARIGLTANCLRALRRAGVLEQIGRGAYVSAPAYRAGTANEQHRLRVRAILRCRPGKLAASHHSAAEIYGLAVLREDLEQVHLTRKDGVRNTRKIDTITIHRRPPLMAFENIDGLDVVAPAFAVIGTAMSGNTWAGVMAADSALRRNLTTKAELEGVITTLRGSPFLSAARHAVALADASAESGGESCARVVLTELGFTLVPQFRILDDGAVIARVDFYIPELGVVLEFDGKVKYAGLDGADALMREKQREDRIRRLGYGVVRLTWRDLYHPARVEALIRAAAATARVHGVPAR